MLVTARRGRSTRVLAGLGTVVALHLVDLVTGAHLEWNTAFGYSPTIGIRFVGQGNMTFAQLDRGGGAVRGPARVAGADPRAGSGSRSRCSR